MNAEHEWWATSYHEAGHAVTRLHYGLPLVAVTITRNRGLTEGGDPYEFDEVDDQRIIGEAVTSFAGPLAETWLLHQWGTRYPKAHQRAFNHSLGDLANIDQLATQMGWTGRALKTLEDEARGLVADVWDSIDTVAEALRDHGHLTGDQIYRIA